MDLQFGVLQLVGHRGIAIWDRRIIIDLRGVEGLMSREVLWFRRVAREVDRVWRIVEVEEDREMAVVLFMPRGDS